MLTSYFYSRRVRNSGHTTQGKVTVYKFLTWLLSSTKTALHYFLIRVIAWSLVRFDENFETYNSNLFVAHQRLTIDTIYKNVFGDKMDIFTYWTRAEISIFSVLS